MTTNVYRSARYVHFVCLLVCLLVCLFIFSILMTTEFLDIFSKNHQIPNFMKIHQKGAQLFHAEERTDGQT
jgi:hypothetical protein